MQAESFHIHLAVQNLNQGKLIAYPTESMFGIGCDPNNLSAVERILEIKHRSPAMGLILIASEISQLEPWVDFKQVPNMQPLLSSWPGHETWLVPAQKQVSNLLTGNHDTLAVRVSAHPIVRQLCNNFKAAITSTSANKNSRPEAKSLFSARQIFDAEIDYYVPGEITGLGGASRIRNALTGQVIRA